jgi:hypothetical protein
MSMLVVSARHLSAQFLLFLREPFAKLSSLLNRNCAQGAVYDLRNASDEPKTASGRVRSAGFVSTGDELAQWSPGLRSATLHRKFIVERELHVAQAGGIDDNSPEVSRFELAPGSHDNVDVRMLGIAMYRRYPGRSAASVSA